MAVLFERHDHRKPAAWQGWDGDRYLVASCSDATELAWLTAWDSPRDASEFVAAYSSILDRMASGTGLAGPLEVRSVDRLVFITTPGTRAELAQLDLDRCSRRVSTVGQLLAAIEETERGEGTCS